MTNRMNRNRLNIGTYHLRPEARDEDHIRELAECGIDFVISVNYDRPALDLFEKYSLGAIVNGIVPGWWGGDGDNAGKLEQLNPLDTYCKAAEGFTDHPAIWAIDIGDEPSALDFPYYGRVFDTVKRLFPKQFPYLNLYPNYASVAVNNASETVNQLGTATYGEHIDAYCRNVPADYVCYDFYVYSSSIDKAYDNLKTVADAARRTGRDMWIVLQVNAHVPDYWVTGNMLRFQAFSAMAFGVNVITWACYAGGWWTNQVLDAANNKTVQYARLQKVNREIRSIAGLYMDYEVRGTHFVGFSDRSELPATITPLEALSTGFVKNLRPAGDGKLIVGDMIARGHCGGRALFVFSADDYRDLHPRANEITFGTAGSGSFTVKGPQGLIPLRRTGDGGYSFTLMSNECAMIVCND